MDDTICAFAFVGFFIFLFPIFINVNAFIDVKNKKGCFGIYLFRFIKIYGGYATLYKEGIAIHLTENKAVLLPFNEMADTRKKFEITDGFQIVSYHQVVEIGNRENTGGALMAAVAAEAVSGALFSFFFAKKKYLSLKSGTLLLSDKNELKVSANLKTVFNVLVLSMAAIKIILEKVLHHERKRKKQKG